MPARDGDPQTPPTATATAGAPGAAPVPDDLPELPEPPEVPGLRELLARLAAVPGAASEPHAAHLVDHELQELPLLALRRRRELLLEEVRRAGHWSRLLRARRDLLVAAAVGAEALEVPVEAGAHGGPLEAHLAAHLPPPSPPGSLPAVADPNDVLRGLVLTAGAGAGGDLAGQLRALAAAARRLGAYEDALEEELELVTDALLRRYRDLVAPSRAAR
ncbi:hypothetical protein MN205_13750 [Kineococcus sp. TRM81007]|uniref:hypothetical protein n=1 Tax=Kineococcus sp. TRM81007 TaxID=2925831 RepID=UPI001F56E31D|nr:hypothetical protein [Kineococcus sp. TRM81007]MCI2239548.1 hypothetical protein [Kineococcus sp. TRM81007]